MLAKAMVEESEVLAGKGASSDDPLLNAAVGDYGGAGKQRFQKIVTVNQRQNKAENVEAAVAAMRAERLPAEGQPPLPYVRQHHDCLIRIRGHTTPQSESSERSGLSAACQEVQLNKQTTC